MKSTKKNLVNTVYTITQFAKKYGLSRSTLLYYDSIGVIKPNRRSPARYRQYGPEEVTRMNRVCEYRHAGLSLSEIKRILKTGGSSLNQALEQRLTELNIEIKELRKQQQFILGLLKTERHFKQIGIMNKDRWKSLLAASGFSEHDMVQWHVNFEKLAPQEHHQFLEFLCLPEAEIRRIRKHAQSALHA